MFFFFFFFLGWGGGGEKKRGRRQKAKPPQPARADLPTLGPHFHIVVRCARRHQNSCARGFIVPRNDLKIVNVFFSLSLSFFSPSARAYEKKKASRSRLKNLKRKKKENQKQIKICAEIGGWISQNQDWAVAKEVGARGGSEDADEGLRELPAQAAAAAAAAAASLLTSCCCCCCC